MYGRVSATLCALALMAQDVYVRKCELFCEWKHVSVKRSWNDVSCVGDAEKQINLFANRIFKKWQTWMGNSWTVGDRLPASSWMWPACNAHGRDVIIHYYRLAEEPHRCCRWNGQQLKIKSTRAFASFKCLFLLVASVRTPHAQFSVAINENVTRYRARGGGVRVSAHKWGECGRKLRYEERRRKKSEWKRRNKT